MSDDLDTPQARLDMIHVVLHAIASGNGSPVALAKAGLDLADLTAAQRAAMRGDGPPAPAGDDDWRWYSGNNDEWYQNGPFLTRDEAVAELDGDAGYVIEARPADPVHFSAAQLIEEQYLENNDTFDCDYAEPDRRGDSAAIVAADAELQLLLNGWCARYAHTFVRGNLFGGTRNAERMEAVPATVETHSTVADDCPTAPAASTDAAR